VSVTRIPYPSAKPVYVAVELWRDRCLLGGSSLFDDGMRISLADALVLKERYVDNPDLGAGDFLSKLEGQLTGSGPAVVQLAAELLFVHLLLARAAAVTGARKLQIVRSVLSLADGI
jgi:5-methylcytosine-specific restriction enzyme B